MTAVALTQAILDRIAAVEPQIEAYITLDAEGALAQAAWLTLGKAIAALHTARPVHPVRAALQPNIAVADIQAAMERVGLRGYEDVPCHSLSAGQNRRVSLARLYLSRAPLWILDEPFTAIDKQGVAAKEKLLLEHARRGGSVILTTHHELGIEGPVRKINLDQLAGTSA